MYLNENLYDGYTFRIKRWVGEYFFSSIRPPHPGLSEYAPMLDQTPPTSFYANFENTSPGIYSDVYGRSLSSIKKRKKLFFLQDHIFQDVFLLHMMPSVFLETFARKFEIFFKIKTIPIGYNSQNRSY